MEGKQRGYFPLDLVVEVLSRSLAASLPKFRVLSKEINALTYTSSFINSDSAKFSLGFFYHEEGRYNYSPKFLPLSSHNQEIISTDLLNFFRSHRIKITATNEQGLLVCVDKTHHRQPEYYVCQPTLKRWFKIPKPKIKYYEISLGILVLKARPLHYKIVRFSKPNFTSFKGNNAALICEVFDSATWRWKKLATEVIFQGMEFLADRRCVHSGGCMHWLTSRDNIFTFDIESETWRYCDLPLEIKNSLEAYGVVPMLVKYERKLSVVFMADKSVQWWVLEAYNSGLWTKREDICIEEIIQMDSRVFPIGFISSEVILMQGFVKLFFFDFTRKKLIKVDNVGRVNFNCIFPFIAYWDR